MAIDPKADLRDFVESNFDDTVPSVPFDRVDDVQIANYDVGPDWPEIAIVSADPVVPGGGQTGATGIDPSGAGPIQDVVYRILVDCWGGPRDAQVYQDHGSDPDTVAVELSQELAATCRVGSDGSPSGYEWIFADPPRDANDVEAEPTEHRQQVPVRLKTTYTP